MNKTAILAGATGLVGNALLHQLLNSDDYVSVKILVRKKIDLEHPKLVQKMVDFNSLPSKELIGNHVFCTLGTTIKKAGSQEAFRKVDHEYPLELAKICLANGAELFALVSSMGANHESRIFYNRVKGEVEKEISELGYSYCGIFRPSMLLGKRNEKRTGEVIGQKIMKALDMLIPANYKAIDASKVAKAMLLYAERPQTGVSIISSAQMR